MTKRQTMTNIHKAQHRILKFERCEPHKRPRVIPGIPERLAVPLILVTHAVLLLRSPMPESGEPYLSLIIT